MVSSFRLVLENVDADDLALASVEFTLEAIRGVGDLLLREAGGNGLDHAAERINLVEVVPYLALDLVGQGLDEVGASERIDRVRDARFTGDDLLLTESQQGRVR